jgi:hypothetical protein
MRLPFLIIAAAVSSFALSSGSTSASPLASGIASGNALPELSDGLVQKVHGWHCRKRYGWYHGHKWWHRHRRACDDYGYYPYSYGTPFVFGFSFGDFDRHHRHHHHHHMMKY